MDKKSEEQGARQGREELCLRLVNTVSWRLRGDGEERLPTADALLRWLGDNDLAGAEDLARLAARCDRKADVAAAVHAAAISLREAVYDLLHAHIEGVAPPREPLALLNAWLARPISGVALSPAGAALHWRPARADADPLDLLRPVALSAADLLTGPRAPKLRQCADETGCGWLFIDESRAQNRRWCSMGDCGNRAKAARHRRRKREAAVAVVRQGGTV